MVAAVVSRGNDLLVCQRPREKRHGGLWEFPGGKCEPRESDADATRRELREELGVEVVDVREEEFIMTDPGSDFQIVFVPTQIIGEPTCHEHIALAWLPPSEVAQLDLTPSARQFLEYRAIRER